MSYTLEYNRIVYKDSKKNFLLLIKQGDNNCYDLNSNLRSRNWYLVAAGTEKGLWKEIGKRAGSTEGGSLQRAVGWNDSKWWSIEDYVKLYRSKIANARDMKQILDDFHIRFIIEKSDKISDGKLSAQVAEMINSFEFTYKGTNYYNKERKIFEKTVRTLDELSFFCGKISRNPDQDEIHCYFLLDSLTSRI